MSRILPIFFNTEMVRAILDGRKTVTRRVAKKIPPETHRFEPVQPFDGCDIKFECHWGGYMPDVEEFADGVTLVNPPCQPGDILYVRETYKRNMDGYSGIDFGGYIYKADCPSGFKDSYNPWHPSIHMPKEAARIWLKVTDVRVERLNMISEEDMVAEGIYSYKERKTETELNYGILDGAKTEIELEYEFEDLWNSTFKKSDIDRYGWDANPWVWVIEFERCEKPENEG